MVKSIYFFVAKGIYGAIEHFSHAFGKAFSKQGVEVKMFDFENQDLQGILEAVEKGKPDCTFTVNAIQPLHDGRLLCDHFQIPHVSWLVDSPVYSLYLRKSPLSIVANVDQAGAEFMQMVHPTPSMFLPHGVDPALAEGEEGDRPIDVAFLGGITDYEASRKEWKQKYSAELVEVMEDVVDNALGENPSPMIFRFSDLTGQRSLDPDTVNLAEVYFELQCYVRAKERVSLVKELKDVKVHIYDEDGVEWQKYLKGCDHVTLNPSVPYEDTFEIMRKSKCVLNSTPYFFSAAHERVFGAMACGSVSITNANPLMSESFVDGEEALLFKSSGLSGLNERVKELISDESRRKEMAEKARAKALKNHSWDCRAEALLKELPGIIKKTKEGVA